MLTEEEKQPHLPGKCHCLDTPRTFDDKFVGYAQSYHDYPMEKLARRYPIRICSVCGKQYVDAPMIA